MQRQSKPAAQVKKVAPPTVPETAANRKSSGSCSSGYSTSSCSSGTIEGTSFNNLIINDNYPSSPCTNRSNIKESLHQGTSFTDNGNLGESSSSSTHPYMSYHYTTQAYSHLVGPRCITSQPGSPMSQDSSIIIQENIYDRYPPSFQAQISLEDQGIDLQSPGRDSPGSSGSSGSGSGLGGSGCRNSTTSLDSGRASSSAYDGKIGHGYLQTHRLSGHSYESSGSLRHSYHSSSSSLGSAEEPQTKHINVAELLAAGYPDQDVLNRWLLDLHFEEYFPLFVQAGYDMPTISRMTPEDLTAIGITKPGHRKKLKAEIARLNISDGLPLFIPNTLIEWLHLLHLEEYEATLYHQGYHSVQQVTDIAWEDLEEIGIKKLGHQKKIMLAIKRVKDIMTGVRRFSMDPNDPSKMNCGKDSLAVYNYQLQEVAITTSKPLGQVITHDGCNQPELRTFQQQMQQHYESHPVDPFHCNEMNTGPSLHHMIPSDMAVNSPTRSYRPPYSQVIGMNSPSHMLYRPDMVAVHISNHPSGARSLENLESNRDFNKYSPNYAINEHRAYDGMLTMRRGSYDDGDITPTNEMMGVCELEGGGTLPRPKVSVKPRPVAKIIAKSRCSSTEACVEPVTTSDYERLLAEKEKALDIMSYNMMVRKEKIGSLYGTLGRGKKTPPPPPKRTNSIKREKGEEKNVDMTTEQAFANCVKNLASKFSISSKDDNLPLPKEVTTNKLSKAEEFCVQADVINPPNSVINVQTNDHSEFSDSVLDPPFLQNDSDCELPVHPKRNDSNSSFDSSSSTDSNSLPFANENIGTIKQRAIKPHPSLTIVEMNSSPRSSPVIPSRNIQQAISKALVPPEYQRESSGMDDYDDVAGDEDDINNDLRSLSLRSQETGDVLSDIGNMLADLTDELDAMLESELQNQ